MHANLTNFTKSNFITIQVVEINWRERVEGQETNKKRKQRVAIFNMKEN